MNNTKQLDNAIEHLSKLARLQIMTRQEVMLLVEASLKANNVKPDEVKVELSKAYKGWIENHKLSILSLVRFCEIIDNHMVDRAECVQVMMDASGDTFETTQSKYSRLKHLLHDSELIEELKNNHNLVELKLRRFKTQKR